MKRWATLVVAVGLLVSLTSACRGPRSGEHTVVTSFYPLYFIAERVAGRYNDIVDLTPAGVEPHEYELTVRQVAQIDLARVGFYESGVAPSVDQAMTNDSPDHTLDVADVVHLTADDPHFWQDPVLMADATNAFAHTMAEADPAHADYYRQRALALTQDLMDLDHDFRTTLRTCRIDTIVVSHDAFEYLARRYHVDVVPIAGLEPDAEPSFQRLHNLSTLIRDRGVTTVFFETLASPDLARSLADDLGLHAAVLDPIEGRTSADPHATYLTLMRQNLAALAKAGECS